MLSSFVFAINAVLPIILMVAIGYILKRIGFITPEFVKMGNKLVFRIFLPAMLFLNVYGIEDLAEIDITYVIYAVLATVTMFGIGFAVAIFTTRESGRRAALLQGVFRSNYALIGIPLAGMLFPGEGEAVATLLSAAIVPVFNVLAVIALSIFSGDGKKANFKGIVLGILKNPLILSIMAGLLAIGVRALFVNFDISFRLSDLTPIYKVLEYLKSLATPLALIVLGGQFEFSAISSPRREIVTGVAMRCVAVPTLALGVAYLLFGNRFGGAEFAALSAAFATPVAVSSVPMAQEMGADVDLAGQLVVFTTIASAFTIFITAFIFSLLGVFPAA